MHVGIQYIYIYIERERYTCMYAHVGDLALSEVELYTSSAAQRCGSRPCTSTGRRKRRMRQGAPAEGLAQIIRALFGTCRAVSNSNRLSTVQS